jgi:GTP-binding protein Era
LTADPSTKRRAGFVAVVGAPNVGKSTLVNRLVGEKVTIVSPKPQTTRCRVVGICQEGPSQVALVDTPGLFEAKRPLDRLMVRDAWAALDDVDEIAFVLDAARPDDGLTHRLARRIREGRRPVTAVLNKIDLVAKPTLLGLARRVAGEVGDCPVFMVSAASGDGVDDLRRHLAARMPSGPWLYPPEQKAALPERLLAAEITREQVYRLLQQEVPFAVTVATEDWRPGKEGGLRIEQSVYVARPGQKAIVIGAKGTMIRAIGERARGEMAQVFRRPVHLFLTVKVTRDERDHRRRFLLQG